MPHANANTVRDGKTIWLAFASGLSLVLFGNSFLLLFGRQFCSLVGVSSFEGGDVFFIWFIALPFNTAVCFAIGFFAAWFLYRNHSKLLLCSMIPIGALGPLLLTWTEIRASARPKYSLAAVNETQHRLSNIKVYYGNIFAANLGDPVEGGISTVGIVRLPFPSEAQLNWDEEGLNHIATVSLKDVILSGFTNGTLYFIFKLDGSVDARAAGNKDYEAKDAIFRRVVEIRKEKGK
jgi:hypothetical protein